MECPECYGQTTVTDTRERPDGTIRRRRECVECGYRFTTVESIAVLKRSGGKKAVVNNAPTKS